MSLPCSVVKVTELVYGVQLMNTDESNLVVVHAMECHFATDTERSNSNGNIFASSSPAPVKQAHCEFYFVYLSGPNERDHFAEVVQEALNTVQKPKRFLVVLNSESGQKRAKQVYTETVQPMLLAAGCAHLLKESQYNRHIPLFATQLEPDAINGVILIGGDGTVNEFLNGLFSRRDWPEICMRLPISLVPCGTRLQLAARFGIGDAAMSVFAALRGRTFALHPIAFIQAKRRFYGHSFLQLKPHRRLFIKFHYLNSADRGEASSTTGSSDAKIAATSSTASSDAAISRGPRLRFYDRFQYLDDAPVPKDVSTLTIAIDANTDLQLVNTFDPTAVHPLALMSSAPRPNIIQKLWQRVSCRANNFESSLGLPRVASGHLDRPEDSHRAIHGSTPGPLVLPKLLAMMKAGCMVVADDERFPPSLNRDRWFVDGEIIGTESIYFESLESPIQLTIPPLFLLE
jgi:hypothetical protein